MTTKAKLELPRPEISDEHFKDRFRNHSREELRDFRIYICELSEEDENRLIEEGHDLIEEELFFFISPSCRGGIFDIGEIDTYIEGFKAGYIAGYKA